MSRIEQALTSEYVRHASNYGFADATWDWTGPGSASNIDLTISDWKCDGHPVYAYFLFWDGALRPDSTPTRRYDYSGCDLGDNSNYHGLSWSTSNNITYMSVVICVDAWFCDDGPCCQASARSGRNPYAP